MNSLVIDIGNTAIKYAIFKNSTIIYYKKATRDKASKNIKNSIKKFKPSHVICSNVSTPLRSLEKALKHLRILEWNKKLKLPFINKYKSETLGQDRLALAAGGQHLFPGNNVLIISAGTCITYDFVDAKGNFLGGAISPGLKMRAKAMHILTARLPEIKLKKQFQLTGNTTQSSLLSGVMNGTLQEMEGIIGQYQVKYKDLKVILAGGDSIYFEDEFKNEIFAPRHLTLIGLHKILQLNISEE